MTGSRSPGECPGSLLVVVSPINQLLAEFGVYSEVFKGRPAKRGTRGAGRGAGAQRVEKAADNVVQLRR